MTPTQREIQQLLQDLANISFVAHRDAVEALPFIQPHGDEMVLRWIEACKALFLYDRDAGKAFIRGSRDAEEASEEVLPWTEQAVRFIAWRGSWGALIGFMEQLADAYSLLGHEGERRWAELGLTWCGRHMESGAAYFRTPVRDLAASQGIAGIDQILAPAEDLFVSRRLALVTYLHGAIKVRNLFGAQAIIPWAKRGTDILQAGRLRGEAYFRLEFEESLSLLREHLPGYLFADHRRLLQMLVSAWYGEPIDVKEGAWSPEQGRAFAETDGRSLFVPVVLPERGEAILAVLHAAGHIAFGSYERKQMQALFREAGAELPPLGENQRMPWRPLYDAYGDDWLRFQLIFDICEDLRVDASINRVVPNHLRRMLNRAKAQEHGAMPGAAYYDFALQSLRLAIDPRAGTENVDGSIPDQTRKIPPSPLCETGERAARGDFAEPVALLRPLLAETATVVDAFRIANEIHQTTTLPPVATLEERQFAYLPGRSPNAARAVYPTEHTRSPEQGAGEPEPPDGTIQQEQRIGEEQREAPRLNQGHDPDQQAPLLDPAGSGARVGRGAPQQARATGGGHGAVPDEKGFPYPEWDYRDKRYKRNWARVQERKLSESNLAEADRLRVLYADALARLKKAIQAQKPTRLAPKSRQLEGDEIDLDATIGFVTEKRAGMAPKPTVYRRRQAQQRDTAVILLADLSTSVMQQLPGGQGRVVDRIRAGILLFAESMEVVGDAYCIAGFSSKYRDSVSYYTIKDFDEPLTVGVRATIGGLSGRLATRMGAAIRHALVRFDAAHCRRRLLLILSDGRPEDYDDGGDIRYLHEDTRIAVKEASDRGVHAFCITVDPAGCEYLPQIFGRGHYLVLDHINSLPKKLPEIYLRLRK